VSASLTERDLPRRLSALLVPAVLADPVTGVTEVAAKDNQFTPPAIQVPAGTTVT
jgi:hypothetical protein